VLILLPNSRLATLSTLRRAVGRAALRSIQCHNELSIANSTRASVWRATFQRRARKQLFSLRFILPSTILQIKCKNLTVHQNNNLLLVDHRGLHQLDGVRMVQQQERLRRLRQPLRLLQNPFKNCQYDATKHILLQSF
jgi:hypothetical protein